MKGDPSSKSRELDIVHKDRDSQAWKKLVSEDVVKFIEDAKLSPSEQRRCVANPNAFFAYPNNVPNALRKQVYLYDCLMHFDYAFADYPTVPTSRSPLSEPHICRLNMLHSKFHSGLTSSI